jgi:crotonobetainyl-CoA:carnitine CoA-transferase CaiB-like acyl-CoA transferase
MRYSSLRNTRVVDLTHHIAGPYATRLLAEAGADVIKVEPPWGEGARKAGPHRNGTSNGDRGGRFAFLNTNKYGVTLNLKHPRGVELLMRMLDGADVLIENFAPGTLARLGLASEDLLKRFPKLSVVSISNFGADGPDRDAKMNDLVLFARGGWTYPVGEKDREPLTPPGSLAQYIGGVLGAIAAMQAMLARDLTLGHGQHVDVALLEAAALTMIYEPVGFQYSGVVRERAGKRFAVGPFMIVTLKCQDGYAGVQCVTDKQFESLCELMGKPELIKDPRFKTALQRYVNNDAWLAMVEEFFLQHDRKWLHREGQARAIPMVWIPNVAELLEWEQLTSRKYFETIDDPVLGRIRIPGAPLRMGSHRAEPTRPAPRLGEHNRDILCGRLGLSDRELQDLQAAGTV